MTDYNHTREDGRGLRAAIGIAVGAAAAAAVTSGVYLFFLSSQSARRRRAVLGALRQARGRVQDFASRVSDYAEGDIEEIEDEYETDKGALIEVLEDMVADRELSADRAVEMAAFVRGLRDAFEKVHRARMAAEERRRAEEGDDEDDADEEEEEPGNGPHRKNGRDATNP